MKAKDSLKKLLFSALAVLVMLSMSSTTAMTAPDGDDIRTGSGFENSVYQQDGNGDLEKFRKELLAHYDSLLALYPYIENAAAPGLLERINQSRERVKSLSHEELLQIKPVFDNNPGLLESQAQLLNVFEQADSVQRVQSLAANSCPATVPDDWCGCPAGAPGGTAAVYIAKGVAQGWEFALVFAPSDLVVVAAGTGGTISSHPVKIALQVFYEASESAALVLEGLEAVNSACHDAQHEAFLLEHDRLVQWKLDNTVELREVDLTVIEIKEKSEFLISATEAGIPLEGVEFLSVKYAANNNPGNFIDVTKSASITMVEKGIYLVRLNGRVRSPAPRIYAFEVKHSDTDANGVVVDHFGFILFDRLGPK
ncbi:MAG: hypothetical protein WCC12_10660 [Anaerolineales bacterium]